MPIDLCHWYRRNCQIGASLTLTITRPSIAIVTTSAAISQCRVIATVV